MMPGEEKALRLRRLKARIENDLESLQSVYLEGERFAGLFSRQTPDSLALRGLSSVLHDFYTGLERVFEHVAETIEGGLPGGLQWHRDLLEDMGTPIADIRPAVLRAETVKVLNEYLRFRHLFRNIYGHELQWERIQPPLTGLGEVWSPAKADLEVFCSFLGDLAKRLEQSSG